MLAGAAPFEVDRFSVPGLGALNFVVGGSMDGGVLASTSIDCVAKGRAQLLLEYPIQVSTALMQRLGACNTASSPPNFSP